MSDPKLNIEDKTKDYAALSSQERLELVNIQKELGNQALKESVILAVLIALFFLVYLQRIEEAINHYSEMIDIDPLSVVAYCNRSQAHYKIKGEAKLNNLSMPMIIHNCLDYQSGLEDAIKAVNLEPENTKALYRRYTGYLSTNRVPEAIQDLNAILAQDPNNQQVS